MKKLLTILICLPFLTNAQNFYRSIRLCMVNYQGDRKAKAVSFAQSKIFDSVGARYDVTDHLVARTYFSYTSLHADDKNGTPAMQQRNLNFQTNILDWELAGQYNFLSFN